MQAARDSFTEDSPGRDAAGSIFYGRGANLTKRALASELSDEELMQFLQEGRPPEHPDNESEHEMPSMKIFPDFAEK